MFKVKIEMQAEVYREDGTLRRRYPWKRIDALLKQFAQILMYHLSQAAQTIKDTAGVDKLMYASLPSFAANAPAATTTYGLVIGTGTDPVTMADNKLQTQVTTNITHQAGTFLLENPDASTWRVACTRVFTNGTGATLEIKEVALYTNNTANGYKFCFDRALYSVSVPNGENVSITYRITITL